MNTVNVQYILYTENMTNRLGKKGEGRRTDEPKYEMVYLNGKRSTKTSKLST